MDIFIIFLLFILNYICLNASIIFIHNFYYDKINLFINKKLLPKLNNFFPTLYEPSYFFEIENKNPIIIETNKYIDQNIYIIENNKIKNFYQYTNNIKLNNNKLVINHNYKTEKKIFLFF
tara:strand:- start:195 stop:554 length:360 start_codon:yes stop_codon:yes gene_type:complete